MEFKRLLIPAFLLLSLFVMIDASIGTRSYGFSGLVRCQYVADLIGSQQGMENFEKTIEARDARHGGGSADEIEPPVLRRSWRSFFGRARTAGTSNTVAALDSISAKCFSCHDSLTTASMDVRRESMELFPGLELRGTHPMGMDYRRISMTRPGEYRPLESLPKEMVFVDGKVGCLSCHDPMGVRKHMLVMENTGSRLCLACHIK